MVLDIIIVLFFAFWIFMILAASFQKPADMPKDFEPSDYPEKENFEKELKNHEKITDK